MNDAHAPIPEPGSVLRDATSDGGAVARCATCGGAATFARGTTGDAPVEHHLDETYDVLLARYRARRAGTGIVMRADGREIC